MTENDKKKLLTLYPPYTKVLGPYFRKDGRQHIVLNDSNKGKGEKGKTKTISFPKALMEIRLGRTLDPDLETIDHLNGDYLDNRPENLQIIERSEHSRLDVKRRVSIIKKCSWCGKEFEISRGQITNNARGYFCSKHCSGKYGAAIQNDKIEKAPEKNHKVEYTTNKLL